MRQQASTDTVDKAVCTEDRQGGAARLEAVLVALVERKARALHAEHARRSRTHPLVLLFRDPKPDEEASIVGSPGEVLPTHWCEHEGHRHKRLRLHSHHGELSSPEELEMERRRRRRRRRRKQLAHTHMTHKHRTLLVSAIDEQAKVIHVLDPDELPRRARYTIMVTACLLLFLCLLLVGVTLRMAPIIDDMAFFVMIMVGAGLGWISPFLGHLNRPDPPFEVTKEGTTWVAALLSLTRPIGTVTAALAVNNLGSKISLWITGFYFLIGWMILVAANSIYMVYGALFFLGSGTGSTFVVSSIYIAEVANPKIRGALMSFVIHGFMIGFLIGNIMGAHLPAWVFGATNLALSVVFLCSFIFMPHTPLYLVRCNKMEEAGKSIGWYNRNADVATELPKLKNFLNSSPQLSLMESLRELMKPINLKTLFMLNIMYSLAQLSGFYTILEYSEVIFMHANVTIISPATLVSIMAAMSIPACWLAIYTTDRFGRTTMLFISCMLLCFNFCMWGIHFQLIDLKYDDPNLQWITIAGAVLFRISLNIGMAPIVITLIGEMFAPNVKSIGSCICNILQAICIFISSKNYQYLIDNLTHKYTFYLCGVLIACVGVYVKLCVPETKGKSLQEIQEMLKEGGKRKEKSSNIKMKEEDDLGNTAV